MDTPNPALQPAVLGALDKDELATRLAGYAAEAEYARKHGTESRDDIWQQNWDFYWGRHDFSDKAEWQSASAMPEPAQYVDRFAASVRLALTQSRFFTMKLPGDKEGDFARAAEKMLGFWLKKCGRSPQGHPIPFSAVFEEVIKLGATSMCASSVTWKEEGRYVHYEPVDPRYVWLDATGRNMYRRRRLEIDKHELIDLAQKADGRGDPIYDLDMLLRLSAQIKDDSERWYRERTGLGTEGKSDRKPVTLDEWIITLPDPNDDKIILRNALVVVANDKFVIRGPEKNPHWHGLDWLIISPVITVPLSTYGRSYMEQWTAMAELFTDLTNLLIDAVQTSSLKAFAGVKEAFESPAVLQEGLHPNMFLWLQNSFSAQDAISEIELGHMPAEAFAIWQGIKSELREGAAFSEIDVGQVPQKGDITATEISTSKAGGSEFRRSIARTIEERLVAPALDLIWRTGLQHMDPKKDQELRLEIGEEIYDMIYQSRKILAQKGKVSFEVGAISALVERAERTNIMVQFLSTIAQIEPLVKALFTQHPPELILNYIMQNIGIDPADLEQTDRERLFGALRLRQAQAAETPPEAPGPTPDNQDPLVNLERLSGIFTNLAQAEQA